MQQSQQSQQQGEGNNQQPATAQNEWGDAPAKSIVSPRSGQSSPRSPKQFTSPRSPKAPLSPKSRSKADIASAALGEDDFEEQEIDYDYEDPTAQADDAEGDAEFDSGAEINVMTFNELVMEPHVLQSAQGAWTDFLKAAGSKDAAGEAIYSAIFEGAPSLQTLFVTPRAVQAVRFMTGISSLINALDQPGQLKISVETLGFGHLNLDVTVPRVVIFRDAILDLLDAELSDKFTSDARRG